ncbi:ECF RNA polymerase sigma factor SigK [Pandoraea anapnoica]|uniref:ECF RNA polymerase sigma factor SigK n=1 Tax=Pandoraea anapnoica TaxID=2508301 RepID=A0A5E4ZZC3_9BURK|nr:sigma-70 family RNA polymerase sigma factor [Pandoraea anapnoica]VVE65300.1 ECF RNA polymerase sigma factor SigK [Pandoraea anapnoica]
MTIADVSQDVLPNAAKAPRTTSAGAPSGAHPQTHGFKRAPLSARQFSAIDKSELGHLLTAAQHGDTQAFAQFYRRTSSLILGAILHIVNNRAAAEDILHDVYVTLWQRNVIFDPLRGDVLPWTLTIARHKAISHLRGHKHHALLDDVLMASLSADNALPSEIFETKRASQRLSDALRGLSTRHRHAITVAYFGGFSYSELATVLGVPEGTAKSWIRRGIASLRQMLER